MSIKSYWLFPSKVGALGPAPVPVHFDRVACSHFLVFELPPSLKKPNRKQEISWPSLEC